MQGQHHFRSERTLRVKTSQVPDVQAPLPEQNFRTSDSHVFQIQICSLQLQLMTLHSSTFLADLEYNVGVNYLETCIILWFLNGNL